MTVIIEPTLMERFVEAPNLARKLVLAALDVDAVSKDGYNEAQRYAFASAENFVGTVRRPLLERGVLVLAGEHETDERLRQTKGGAETAITTFHLTYTLMDAETGEKIELPWLGRGEDPMDKGIGKALTNALKTFLRQQLLIPYGQDDPEADEGSDQRASGVVNLASQVSGSGLSNTQLNEILVGAGLPAEQGNPFRAFMRVPEEKAEIVERLIAGARS
jgi:hypothetical protein